MARTAIQSNLAKNKFAKLSYSVRGPYQIVRHTGFGSYFMRKLHKQDGSKLKFMSYDLYLLLPSLEPCEPVDTADSRYINEKHNPLVNPLKKSLHIELYNEKWFSKPISTSAPPIMYQHDTLRLPNDIPLSFPSVSDLHMETKTYPSTPILEKDDDFWTSPPSPLTLHNILNRSDCLFFVRYIPENTLKSNWFLV